MSPKEIAEVRKSLCRVQLGYRVSVLLLKLAINLYGKLKVEILDYTCIGFLEFLQHLGICFVSASYFSSQLGTCKMK